MSNFYAFKNIRKIDIFRNYFDKENLARVVCKYLEKLKKKLLYSIEILNKNHIIPLKKLIKTGNFFWTTCIICNILKL